MTWAEKKLGITETYKDYDEMLVKADLDAVSFVTSSSMRLKKGSTFSPRNP